MASLLRVHRNESFWNEFCNVARGSFRNWHPPTSRLCNEFYGLQVCGNIAGTVSVEFTDGYSATLFDVAIQPEHRRQGLGLEMLSQLDMRLSSRFKRVSLTTEPRNVDFYKAAGFDKDPHNTSLSFVLMNKCY